MLPTSGYFRGVSCPGHEKGHCNRPYCHFRHNPKKEKSLVGIQNSSTGMEESSEGIITQLREKPVPLSAKSLPVEDSPSCSNTEDGSILKPSINAQSELLQQLVSEAVKKVLIENPHLTTVGVDPSTLLAQTAVEVSPANSKSKKKYYLRPPDTPSYNPTPIRELNKRKRSGEGIEDLPTNSKAAKYVPASLTSMNVISDASENKESDDSDATEFSSAEDDDVDKQNCDFDILEEVLAEHSQNNKIKVKKKKVKALGKLQYNLSNLDKKVDESSMISDARTLSDQDSNTFDGPKDSDKDIQEPIADSYFLPPSPVFTSSSDGFGAYNSVVYGKNDANDDEEEEESSKSKSTEDGIVVKKPEESYKSDHTERKLESSVVKDQKQDITTTAKKVSKGHALLPKFVHALSVPKMSRPNVRNWNPQGKSASAADTCKDGSDPIEAMLQQMDGDQAVQKEGTESSNATQSKTGVQNNSKKYKVDLDKEIKSLTSSPKVNEKNATVVDRAVEESESCTVQKEKGCNLDERQDGTDDTPHKKKDSYNASVTDKGSPKDVSPKEKQKKVGESLDSQPVKESNSKEETIGKDKSHDKNSDPEKTGNEGEKSHDDSSEAEETINRKKKSHCESESEEEPRKKKRKRDHSSDSESGDSYRRKKRKKSHKHRKKYKKRRRRRDSRSESDDSDVESSKEDKKDDKIEKDKLDSSEADDKVEIGKTKKHKKRKKKSKHRKKSKYKRRNKSKYKKKERSHSRSASLSSSQDRSRSTSLHRSRSSSRMRSRSSSRHSGSSHRRSRSGSRQYRSHSRQRSRSHSQQRSRSHSRHRSRSHSRHRSRSHSRHRSRSHSQQRSKSRSRHRSRSLSRYKHRSISRHRSRSPSKERVKSPKKTRYSSQSHSTSQESENLTGKHGKDSRTKLQIVNESATISKRDREKGYPVSTPMPIDPAKIKVEKEDVPRATSTIVPDLSIVKKEKEDVPLIPCASIKVEKSDDQNGNEKGSSSTDKQKNNNLEKVKLPHSTDVSVKCREESRNLNDMGVEKDISSCQKFSKESAHNLQQKAREHRKGSLDKDKRDSHYERRHSVESNKDKKKSSYERRSSTESSSTKKCSSLQNSTDSDKGEKDRQSSKVSVSERRSSTDKNKDGSNASSGIKQDSQTQVLSIFDMVLASMEPSKPRALKEISIFDKVSAVGYESSSDSSLPSDHDDDSLPQIDIVQEESASHPSTSVKKSSSHATSKDKHSYSKTNKDKAHSKSDKDKQLHKSSSDSSKSKSHRESRDESKHSHSSSSKHRTSSHHSSSSSNKSSNSSPKSNNISHKEPTSCNDSGSSLSNKASYHVSSSKNKESKSSSHVIKQENKNSSRSSHSRRHSVGSLDKEKENSSTNHKNREHSRKHSEREKERTSDSHGKGKESSKKDGVDNEKDYSKISGHDRQKENSRKRHGKDSEHSSSKKDVIKDKVIGEKEAVSSSSDRDPYADHDDADSGNNSPFPDLSVLDEIPQDDWEQMINSTEREDLRHLESLRTEEDFDLDDLDKDDPAIMEECLKMFNDYKPDPADVSQQSSSKRKVKSEQKDEPELPPAKLRVARTTTGGNMLATKSSADLKVRKKTPGQVMMERYQKLKEQQAELLKQLERQKQQLEEQGRGVAGAASSSTVSSTTPSRSRHASVSSSNVSSTTPSRSRVAPASSSTSLKSSPHSTSGVPKRRMSHVPNVASLLQAKEKIKNLQSNSKSLLSPSIAKASGALPQTAAHTVAKGGKRFAHVPKLETLQRPAITPEFGSKVPPNIRQRYLNSLIDECLKFLSEKDAYNLGLAEERVCVQRASSRMVYLNLAVNAVKRLRSQQEPGEAAQELLENDPMFKDSDFIVGPSSSEKPSTSGISSSPAKEVKPHPINPNHSRLSHFSVLAVGGQKGSWSIEKPKKSAVNVQNYLKGANFYKYLKKYILTEQQLEENGYPCPDPEEKGKAIVKVVNTRKKISPSHVERFCDRCSVLYKVDKWGFPLSVGPCVHHWGRPYKRRGYSGFESRYSCCGGDLESDGCCQATTHVSQNYNPNELRGFVRTLPKDFKDNEHGVFALDCEMCYTTAGNELTRVTVIDPEGNTVYEQLVKPENPIIDYNTRFSGITEADMEDVKTTLRDVQASILTKFSDKTILIGHSLESDFHALKLIHDTVVDTSVVFPHKMGAPFKRALKNLASEYLKKIIQNDVSGHDSAEDAVSCMHLMQWRIKEDLKGFGQK